MDRVKYLRIALVISVLFVVVLGVCFWNGHRLKKAVTLTPAEVQNPAIVAEKLDVSPKDAAQIVKEVKVVTPVMVIEQNDGKNVNLYQIKTEPSWRFGLSLSARDLGITAHHGDSDFTVFWDYKDDAFGVRYTFYFASLK